jgi:hypothetical protein
VATEGRDLLFPYPEGLTKRRYSADAENPFGLEKEGRRFVWRDAAGGPAGAGQVPYLPPDFEPGQDMFLVEGESDTLSLWQNAPEEARKGIIGLSGTGSWGSAIRGREPKTGNPVRADRLEELFGKARRVFVIFDRDDPYENPDGAKSTERAWLEIKKDLGRKAKRVVLPQGINDVSEFFLQYDWSALRVKLKAALAPVRHYHGMDLSKPVPPTDWLVEDLFVAGEATVLAADSGTGKSWLTMQLALAVAGDETEFLGCRLAKHGNVVYVDEENPGALVHQRLTALGMTAAHRERLDYLWYEGVDLRTEPERLLEHCLEQDPVLIVLDSLSRIAPGVEENSNTDMSQLFRKGIIPLARETGAAVIAVHHTSRAGNDVRGASAIRAAADQAIQMVAAESKQGVKTGNINLFPSKPRRQLTHLTVRIEGDLEKDGVVRVREQTEDTPY